MLSPSDSLCADATIDAMAQRLEERGQHEQFSQMIRTYVEKTASSLPDRPLSVLDLGCGTGVVIRSFLQRVHPESLLHGADISNKLLQTAISFDKNKQITWTKLDVDALELPYADEQFDIIVLHTVRHFRTTNTTRVHITYPITHNTTVSYIAYILTYTNYPHKPGLKSREKSCGNVEYGVKMFEKSIRTNDHIRL